MDSETITTRSELKSILCDERAEPKALSLTLLKEITNGFSEVQEIGRGGYAVVYKVRQLSTVVVLITVDLNNIVDTRLVLNVGNA
jgi:coatomer subunit beta'